MKKFNMRGFKMKTHYDFSKAEREKFYHPNLEIKLPIYLEDDVEEFFNEYAQKQEVDIQILVNAWLRSNIAVVQSVKSWGQKSSPNFSPTGKTRPAP